jgi:hypothetical protein
MRVKAETKKMAMLADLFATLGRMGYYTDTVKDTVDLNRVVQFTYLSKSKIFSVLDLAQNLGLLTYRVLPASSKVEIELAKDRTNQPFITSISMGN